MLLKRLAQGEPLSRICADPGMPARRTVYTWFADAEFFARYESAVRAGIHARALKSTKRGQPWQS
ncbi:hypothetical protein [Paraburkholderia sp. UYCP14C]|uniref:terminase small subunit-like protein n=1 Tax=Paraburkholderia sp. UYCP14C TaxID=2511130 RepID=UPI0035A09F59